MQAIEFEATTFQHTIRVPDDIPDGVTLRVLLLVDESKTKDDMDTRDWKPLLGSMPNLGSNEDFAHTNQTKVSALPEKLKFSRDEINERRPEYLTMPVIDIEIPSRDERYAR